MKTLYYKFLVLFFYYVGDCICELPWEWSANIYQKAMNLSLKYDEEIDFWFWQEPPLDKEEDDL